MLREYALTFDSLSSELGYSMFETQDVLHFYAKKIFCDAH